MSRFAPVPMLSHCAALLLAACVALPGTILAAAPALPAKLALTYDMTYRGIPVGELNRVLELRNGVYHFESHAAASGLGKIVTSDSIEESGEFEIAGGDVRPRIYRVMQSGAKGYDRVATFDWNAGRLRLGDGRDVALPAGCQDSASMLYHLMLRGAPASEREIHITDGKKIARYAYFADGAETLDTPIGRLKTVRVTRRHPTRDETFTVWLATERRNLPVKIEKRRGGKPESTLLIHAVQGM